MDVDDSPQQQQASAPDSEKAQAEAEATEQPTAVEGILKTDEFWADLKGFLVQRLNDEKEGERLGKLFREAAGKQA